VDLGELQVFSDGSQGGSFLGLPNAYIARNPLSAWVFASWKTRWASHYLWRGSRPVV